MACTFLRKSGNSSRRLRTVQQKLHVCEKLLQSQRYDTIESQVSGTVYKFLMSQVRNCHIKSRGRPLMIRYWPYLYIKVVLEGIDYSKSYLPCLQGVH